jgi:hypothetical protein
VRGGISPWVSTTGEYLCDADASGEVKVEVTTTPEGHQQTQRFLKVGPQNANPANKGELHTAMGLLGQNISYPCSFIRDRPAAGICGGWGPAIGYRPFLQG